MTVLLVIIFMAFGIGAVAGDSVDKAEAMASAKKIFTLVHRESAIDALAPEAGANATLAAASGGLAVTFEDGHFWVGDCTPYDPSEGRVLPDSTPSRG